MQDNLHNRPIKKLLDDAEIKPREQVWQRIKEKLPAGVNSRINDRLKAAALLFLLLSSVSLYWTIGHYRKNGGVDRSARIPERVTEKVADIKTPINKSLIKTRNQQNQQSSYESTIVTTIEGSDLTIDPVSPAKHINISALPTSRKNISKLPGTSGMQNSDLEIVRGDDTKNLSNNDDPISRSENELVTASLNRQELAHILEREEMLAYTSPVPIFPFINTGADLVHYLSPPQPISVKETETNLSDAEALKNAYARKLKHQKKMAQFRIYDVMRGFHMGVFVGVNNNWLTRKADHLEMGSSSIRNKAHFGISYGIVVGYDYTERWGIQLEMAIRSRQGQRYEESTPSGKVDKSLNLCYLKFPLLVKYKIAQLNDPNRRPIALNVLLGPQFNILREKELLVDGVPQLINRAGINHTELGILGGIDLDIYLHKNLYLTLGARAGMCSPLQKNMPMSFQFGLTTQFQFRLPPRE